MLLVELPFVCLFVVGFSHVGWGSCRVVAGGASEFCAFGGFVSHRSGGSVILSPRCIVGACDTMCLHVRSVWMRSRVLLGSADVCGSFAYLSMEGVIESQFASAVGNAGSARRCILFLACSGCTITSICVRSVFLLVR